MIKVLLADDHAIVRAGLRRIVTESDDMTVVAEAADGNETLQKTRSSRPDVVVVDISMPGMDGLEVIGCLQDRYPDLPVVVLTMYEEEPYVAGTFAAGARGYLTKQSAPEQLVTAIRKVVSGGRYLTEKAELSRFAIQNRLIEVWPVNIRHHRPAIPGECPALAIRRVSWGMIACADPVMAPSRGIRGDRTAGAGAIAMAGGFVLNRP